MTRRVMRTQESTMIRKNETKRALGYQGIWL